MISYLRQNQFELKYKPVDNPPAIQICQWGSKTGITASQPAVGNWRSPTEPHPYTGRVLYSHLAVFTAFAKSDLVSTKHPYQDCYDPAIVTY